MDTNKLNMATKLVHAGEPQPRIDGSVTLPIFQSSTYVYSGEDDYHSVRYLRCNNSPNHLALHEKLASLENAQAGAVTASGMAAISTALLALLKSGDHILCQDCLYGGTFDLITKDFEKLGISHDFIDGARPRSWQERLKPNTRLIYVETITNPLMQVTDLEAVVKFAREHKLVSVVDNTFASPVNFRPAERGFDLSIHSCTKYLNGHSDIVAGAVIGRKDLVEEVLHKLNHLGGALDPHACFLLQRGMKTLSLRVAYQNQSAMRIAQFLEGRDAVSRVNYPGLESSPSHAAAKRLLDGYSGMLSFEMKGGVEAAERLIGRLQIPILAPSLGGVESLITRPATTSHSGLTPREREAAGISDGLIRFSVGIEDTDDLLADFSQALEG